jgi:hypothetical protein
MKTATVCAVGLSKEFLVVILFGPQLNEDEVNTGGVNYTVKKELRTSPTHE